ncbi:hypothetical protein K402DRAFT_390309 [Aulographum hederae CBS 113979]|uniref:Uncharacterized protein n=1 Tax=Aulographum hederae CBS 113979 TaxID=1176131 RepID=A0A6G1HAD3_9PEZI|nr:hypothetical protein K402DRAFT_390309 [Aulographum hederae CBS 113979]
MEGKEGWKAGWLMSWTACIAYPPASQHQLTYPTHTLHHDPLKDNQARGSKSPAGKPARAVTRTRSRSRCQPTSRCEALLSNPSATLFPIPEISPRIQDSGPSDSRR